MRGFQPPGPCWGAQPPLHLSTGIGKLNTLPGDCLSLFFPWVENTQDMVCPEEIRDWEDQLSHSAWLPEANSKTVLSPSYSIVFFFQGNFKSPKWQCFHYFPEDITPQSNIFHCQEVFIEIPLKISLLISFHLLSCV